MNFTSLAPWYPDTVPTKTYSLLSVAPTESDELMSIITSAASRVVTETDIVQLYYMSQIVRGALASMTIIKAQEYLETGQALLKPLATEAIYNATINIDYLTAQKNIYTYDLNLGGNSFFLALFFVFVCFNFGLLFFSNHTYFTWCFLLGTISETLGYIARVVAHFYVSDTNFFLMQIICLTIAPTFLSAGIYYLLGQFLLVHSTTYGLLSPFTYSYIFVACDIISLVLQGVGGCMAGVAVTRFEDTLTGTHIMLGGIAFQVVSLTLFLVFWFHFIGSIYFKNNKTSSFKWYDVFGFLLHDGDFEFYKEKFEEKYDPHYSKLRTDFFYWFPIPITTAVLLIYIRCIYRVVELSQGWRGYLITHEKYLFLLDGMVVGLCCLIFVPFNPCVLFKNEKLSLFKSKKKTDTESEEKEKPEGDAYSNTISFEPSLQGKGYALSSYSFDNETPEVEQRDRISEEFTFQHPRHYNLQ